MNQAVWRTIHALLAVALVGCSSMEMAMTRGYADTGYWGMSEANDMASGTTSSWGTGTTASTGFEETEEDSLLLPPAQTDVYVFVANPNRDTVTRVNVLTHEVRTTEVGREPSLVLTTPDYRHAAVFNQGEDSVSIIESESLSVNTVDVRDNFNAMVMSPEGMWVALWHDQDRDDAGDSNGLQSFNEVSFVHLPTGDHFPMAVGYNPGSVVFTPDGALAAVVSDAYLAVVDLTAETPLPQLIALSDDLLNPPEAQEVLVSPNGSYAFVRQFGVEELLVVDLDARTVDMIPVGTNPTDIDLAPGGMEAIVVARGSNEVHVLQTTDPFAPAHVVDLPEGVSLGSIQLDPTGDLAIVYTTASALDVYATWDRTTDEVVLRPLVKPIDHVAISPNGESMMVFHTYEDAPDADHSSPFFEEWAVTLVSISNSFLTNPLLLEAEPTGYANGTNGDRGFFIMDGEESLVEVDYRTLLHESIDLKSEPVFVGVLPDLDLEDGQDAQAWASQEHHLGRISFYDPNDASLETITGFELNADIEED